jgi:hypothetical protein
LAKKDQSTRGRAAITFPLKLGLLAHRPDHFDALQMLPPSPVPKRETFKVPQTFAQALALHTEAIQAGDFGANGRKPGQSLSRSCAGDSAGKLHRKSVCG